jgi:hypothetical protein
MGIFPAAAIVIAPENENKGVSEAKKNPAPVKPARD